MSLFVVSLIPFFGLSQDSTLKKDTFIPVSERISCVEISPNLNFCLLPIEKKQENNWLLYQPEVDFWVEDIQLSADSFLVVDQVTRTVIDVVHKNVVGDIENGGNLKCLGQLYKGICFEADDSRIKFVRGKRSFFNYSEIGPHLSTGMEIFESLGVDPLYAQLLLLIESPNNPKAVSSAGARGHFQLMPSVARKYGLQVNRYTDDRIVFDKSAKAAAKSFKYYCIPSVKRICSDLQLEVEEDALWFKLLVLHVYNAGGGNVRKAAMLHKGLTQGNDLITSLWHTKVGAFGNSSQNYSQLCLASYLAYQAFLQKQTATYVTNSRENDIQ